MNKKDLVRNVSNKSKIVQDDVSLIINLALEELSTAFHNQDNVTIAGFGTFTVETKEEKEFQNPSTKKTSIIPRSHKVKFRLSHKLRNSIRNSLEANPE